MFMTILSIIFNAVSFIVFFKEINHFINNENSFFAFHSESAFKKSELIEKVHLILFHLTAIRIASYAIYGIVPPLFIKLQDGALATSFVFGTVLWFYFFTSLGRERTRKKPVEEDFLKKHLG